MLKRNNIRWVLNNVAERIEAFWRFILKGISSDFGKVKRIWISCVMVVNQNS